MKQLPNFTNSHRSLTGCDSVRSTLLAVVLRRSGLVTLLPVQSERGVVSDRRPLACQWRCERTRSLISARCAQTSHCIAFAVSDTVRVRNRESLLTVVPRHRSHWSPTSLRRIAQDRLPKSHLVLTASDSVGSTLLAVSATRRVRIRESLLTL